ncbi:hypothetical protein CFK37_01565 [Virgibacillus phasianinus]|uniref:CTP synthase n=1 Tax=Virgibacillus phasianinus TaxID=2017483 RepID=A0A220TZ08_9BACI|nr:DUF6241 domain-containing protein [Virgibacillus phasianinus]ASK60990.1 hypothetical protein CFK37_01565 [Virgibacillus phasianinus]
MKRTIIIIACATVVLGLVAWGTYSFLSNGMNVENASAAKEKEEAIKGLKDNREKIDGTITEKDLTAFREKGLNPFGESTKMTELNDYIYQEYIHGMSHQKVQASKKWGFYEIHSSRIEWLLAGLAEVDLDHEDIYRDILGKWQKGNFSNVDDDHNTIWMLQDGTVGKATGVLSTEEEQAYLNANTD